MKPKAQVEYRAIADLKELPGNPRTIKKDQFEKLKQSIKDNADYFEARPIILSDRTGKLVILAGNQRYKAAKAIGLKEVPTILLPNLTEEREKEIIIRDNVENGDWDWDELANTWDAASLTDWGVQMPDWASEAEAEIIEDEAPEPPAEPKSKLGEIYQLGDHRLMVGDSTKVEQVTELMGGKTADMVFTDPPYRLETEGGCKGDIGKSLRKQGSSIAFISDFDPSEFLEILPIIFRGGTMNAYIFCNKELLPEYLNWATQNKYAFNVLVWKKPTAIPIADSHRPDIEYLLFFRKNAIWNNGLPEVNYSRCLEFGRESGLHPTMKPVGLIANEIKISSNPESVILDLYGGSGSTLIACEQLNRRCYMMELDPHYADVIIERWEKFTGEKAVRIKGAA